MKNIGKIKGSTNDLLILFFNIKKKINKRKKIIRKCCGCKPL
jgi:hypothetical protein